MDPKATVENFFERVWHQEDKSAIRELFVPKSGEDLAHGLDRDKGLTPEDFEAFHDALLGLVENMRISVDNYFTQGDWICAECTVTSNKRDADSGPVVMKGCCVARVADGKIIEARNYFDFLHLFEGLQLLPESTFEKCLTGDGI